MARFLTVEDITGKEYPYSKGKYDWIYGELDQNYPYIIEWYEDDSIDWNRKTSDVPRIEVRRWCERNLDGDVIVFQKSNSKFRHYDEDRPFRGGYQVHAHWVEFHFELETDSSAFKLRWL